MPGGGFPDASGRKVLLTDTHSVSGSVQMPNGATDYGRVGLGATGPGWCATTDISVTCDTCSAGFHSGGPESTGGTYDPYIVRAGVTLGNGRDSVSATVDFHDAPGPYSGIDGPGRGAFGDTISGSFSFSCMSDLVLYSYGEDLPDDATPDDAYPSYGGVRIVGEFPSNYGLLVWEPHPGSSVTGSVTFGGRSASCSAPSSAVYFTDLMSFGVGLGHSPGVGVENRPGGTLVASLNVEGYPVSSTGASAYYEYSGGGGVACSGRVGAGYVEVEVDTFSEGVPSGQVGGIFAGGFIRPTRRGQVQLDATAMDQSHPHPCAWKLVKSYLGVIPPAAGEEYGTIVDPPSPIVTDLTGQSVSDTVEQRHEGLAVSISNKSVGPKHRTSGSPAQGTINGFHVVYDHYRNDRGRVMGWIVPPPGEHPHDWRVGWLGIAQDALTVGHSASVEVSVGGGESHDGGTLYDLHRAVSEGYRYADVVSDGTILTTAGKAWPLPGDDSTPTRIDLCFPSGIGSGSPPDHDSQDTRWPLDAERKSTVNTPYWGVSILDALTISGGSLTSMTLKRAASPKLHFLAPFVPVSWEMEVPDDILHTGDGDEYTVQHYCSRLAIGDVDGRQGIEIPHVRRTDNYAPGRLWVSDYTHLSVSSLPGFFAEVPGWLASSASTEAGALPAWFMGLGFIRQGGSWTKSYDRGTGTFKAQPRYDSMEWPGDVTSDVFQVGGGSILTLVGRKPFRGAAYGATKNDATVQASDIAGPGTLSQGTSNKRYGLLGPTLSPTNDWGLVWVDPSHKASVGGLPRRIQRVAFAPVPGGKILGFFARPDGRLIRIVDQSGTAHIGLSDVPGRATWDERDLGPGATDASVHRGVGARSVVALVTDGVLNLTIDASEGRQPPIMSVSDGNAKSGDLCAFGEGLILVARLDGGTLKTTLRNATDLSYVDGPFTTGVTGLPDDAVVRVDDVRLGGNRPGVVALIVANGTTTSYLSDDGKTFT